jgi:hypothetical protein
LLNAVKENVDIQVLIRLSDVSDLNIDDHKIFKLAKEGKIKLYFSKKLHAKFYIFDNRRAVIGSSNLTDSGLNRFEDGNLEVAIYTENKNLIGDLKETFEKTEKVNIYRGNFIGFLYRLEPPFLEILSLEPKWYPFVEIISEKGNFIAKLDGIRPYKSEVHLQEISKKGNYEENFLKAYLLANFLNAKELYIHSGKLLETDKVLPELGSPVIELSKERAETLMLTYEGFSCKYLVKLGRLEDSDIPVYIDLEKLIERHSTVCLLYTSDAAAIA